jgi:hypothetical protein
MRPQRFFILFMIALAVMFSAGCKKKDTNNSPALAHAYSGSITLEYSKGFPQFSVSVMTDAAVAKDGKVTFGPGDSDTYDKEDIYYEGGKPATKIHMSGTLTFHEAKGEYRVISGKEYLLVWVHTSNVGRMTVWAWDDELGWIQVLDTPYAYEDTYNDGQMQFLLDDAVISGALVSKTLPDLQGTFTYGYTLRLTIGL